MKPDETAFETFIDHHLVSHGGYRAARNNQQQDCFDARRGLDLEELFAFIDTTQAKAWAKLVKRLGGDPASTREKFADRLASELDKKGTVEVLRHGVVDHGITLRLAYFKPAHGLTPELIRRYDANRLTITRQLRFDPASNKSIDIGLFINGIPVATAEIKNPLTGQTIEQAKKQYRQDRDPRNCTLTHRAVVHFALDTRTVAMTTRLAGNQTRFLPFNKGHRRGPGNPPNPNAHCTAYLWEEVWQRDAWLDLFARFIHVEKPLPGSKARPKVIFPRYHQWDAVRSLETAARQEGPGKNYLVQHSAGSGKSNTIAWLSHRLSNLHTTDNKKVFDKVVVITDRVVLDRQLQDTIYQFEHAHGVVERIEKSSQQLADALAGEQARIIITTLQKFPFVLEKVGSLPSRSYAVVVDEAHSSQTGEAAKEMKRVLGVRIDDEISDDDLPTETLNEALAEAVTARGPQSNLSFFAFTATPKGKTLELFGRLDPMEQRHQPFHLYSMHQAIAEGFIEDVLANYTTYDTYYRLEKAISDDPALDTRKARAAIARFITLHETALDQKASVIVEHFRRHVARKIAGKAKAMVVCSSRPHAVKFCRALRATINQHGYSIGVLVAFSGKVNDGGQDFSEASMNGFSDRETKDRFDTDQFRIMVVAEKFQTGFDQPLLYVMYVDKILSGLAAVQTLSRLNRIHPDKRGTFVLDFRNKAEDIQAAFEPYYGETVASPTDPNLLYDIRQELDVFGVLRVGEMSQLVSVLLKFGGEKDHAKVYAALGPARERFEAMGKDEQARFRDALRRFVRIYAFLSQIVSFGNTDLERDYLFCKALALFIRDENRSETMDLSEDVELTHLRLTKEFEGSVSLDSQTGEVITVFSGTGKQAEPKPETLSSIIELFNERFGTDWTDADRLFTDQIEQDLAGDEQVQLEATANDLKSFRVGFNKKYLDAIASRLNRNERVAVQLLDNEELRAALVQEYLPRIYAKARVARRRVCPVAELLGLDREDETLEYKSTLRWDIRAKSAKTGIPEKAAVKTIAGFLNTAFGGILLLGVADDGSTFGLEADYASFSKRGQCGDHDLFGQHLQNLLISRLGEAAAAQVAWTFHHVNGGEVCRINVTPSDFPVFEGTDEDDRVFWWRDPTGTKAIKDAASQDRLICRRFGG